mmetsp:Transcript_3806/g.12122  ORF Transcript_3806/g.12122 Transcript_3806/m.12122 type:complete len:435 (+) Transcript_3806:72-1376(+)
MAPGASARPAPGQPPVTSAVRLPREESSAPSTSGAPDGYLAVEAGSPRTDRRVLEAGSRQHDAALMSLQQKIIVSCAVFVLVLLTICCGTWVGVQLGNLAIEQQAQQAEQQAQQQRAHMRVQHTSLAPHLAAPRATRAPAAAAATSSTTTTHASTSTSSEAPTTTEALVVTSTSTATTATTTTTITSTVTHTTTMTKTMSTTTYSPTLFCFSIMRSSGYELSLVRVQLAQGLSIFACDAYTVFSDDVVWLTPGPPVRIDSEALGMDLEAPEGVKEHILNTEIFLQAWENVRKEGRYKQYEWVVKVDPDAVFFPDRLRKRLDSEVQEGGSVLYFLNCQVSFGLFGALEVFSRKAMEAFYAGLPRCKSEVSWKDVGEDLFMRQCMDHLGVDHAKDYELLADGYCNTQPSPCSSGQVAFHPFKNVEIYLQCVREAKD